MGVQEAILGSMFAGAGFDAIGQYRASRYNASIMEQNARIAEMQARDARARGREAESRYRVSVRQLIGAQRAGYAAQGIDVGEGTALDVQAETAALGELDALTIRNNAAREAWGYRVGASDASARAKLTRLEGTMGAASTILTGGTQAAYTGYRLGVFGG